MTTRAKLDLANACTVARGITEGRLDLGRQIDRDKLIGFLDADFAKRWYPAIAAAASMGATTCHVGLTFPRKSFPSLYRRPVHARKDMVMKIISGFLGESGFRAGYADWQVKSGKVISVIVLLKWGKQR